MDEVPVISYAVYSFIDFEAVKDTACVYSLIERS